MNNNRRGRRVTQSIALGDGMYGRASLPLRQTPPGEPLHDHAPTNGSAGASPSRSHFELHPLVLLFPLANSRGGPRDPFLTSASSVFQNPYVLVLASPDSVDGNYFILRIKIRYPQASRESAGKGVLGVSCIPALSGLKSNRISEKTAGAGTDASGSNDLSPRFCICHSPWISSHLEGKAGILSESHIPSRDPVSSKPRPVDGPECSRLLDPNTSACLPSRLLPP